jgi:hypothetical protein
MPLSLPLSAEQWLFLLLAGKHWKVIAECSDYFSFIFAPGENYGSIL